MGLDFSSETVYYSGVNKNQRPGALVSNQKAD
jgi:hypothetical protein